MSSNHIEKIDFNLLSIYNEYLEQAKHSQQNSPSFAYNLSLRYENDLSLIESLGFKTSWAEITGLAHGDVHLKDLKKITEHPNVISLSYGQKKKMYLDHSVKDIHVRTQNSGDVGTTGLWHMDINSGTLTGTPPSGYTGRGVIVGIIDTGIDISHPSFSTGTFPFLSSRILKLWDQGLTPAAAGGRAGPVTSLLGVSTRTYGVEYDKAAIDNFLNGATACPSKDCVGHGTHVAGIAAGNGETGDRLFSGGNFDKTGVAPEADLVIVKHLDIPDNIRDVGGHDVSFTQRFKDAIFYVLKVAQAAGKAAVINCSFGSPFAPHDGLSEDEQFLDTLFTAGATFYNGNVIVFAAGNEAGDRSHAKITVPASRQITIPFTLYDKRSSFQDFEECGWKDNTKDLVVDIWYKEVTPPEDVSVAVKVPGDTSFSSEVFSGFLTKTFDGNKKRTIVHNAVAAINRPNGLGGTVSVQRNNIFLQVEPNKRVSPNQHKTGLYELRITAPVGTELYAWCFVPSRLGFRVGTFTRITLDAISGATTLTVNDATGFKVNDSIRITLDDGNVHTTTISSITFGGAPDTDQIGINAGLTSAASTNKSIEGVLPAGIVIEDRHQISDTGAKNIITVAAYDDNNGNNTAPYRHIATFSSRGPLVDYSGLGPYADKPDISAPGVAINSAKSASMNGGVGLSFAELVGNRFVEFQGTSMSAPHVAGLIALLLQKDRNLNVDRVKSIFNNMLNNQDGLNPPRVNLTTYKEHFGNGIIDGKKAADAV